MAFGAGSYFNGISTSMRPTFGLRDLNTLEIKWLKFLPEMTGLEIINHA